MIPQVPGAHRAAEHMGGYCQQKARPSSIDPDDLQVTLRLLPKWQTEEKAKTDYF